MSNNLETLRQQSAGSVETKVGRVMIPTYRQNPLNPASAGVANPKNGEMIWSKFFVRKADFRTPVGCYRITARKDKTPSEESNPCLRWLFTVTRVGETKETTTARGLRQTVQKEKDLRIGSWRRPEAFDWLCKCVGVDTASRLLDEITYEKEGEPAKTVKDGKRPPKNRIWWSPRLLRFAKQEGKNERRARGEKCTWIVVLPSSACPEFKVRYYDHDESPDDYKEELTWFKTVDKAEDFCELCEAWAEHPDWFEEPNLA